MPRWPAGLHVAAGALRATGQRPGRIQSTPHVHYWRRQVAELHASTPPAKVGTATAGGPGGGGTVTIPSTTSAAIGPHGVGERWFVDLVQVFCSSQYGQAPLVVQQVTAQATGLVTSPPPPIVAQVWLSASGVLLHMLAQTTSGGNDSIGVSGQALNPGERLTVLWYGAPAGDNAWAVLRGTKVTLDV